jgi:hypothetical protein
MKIECSKKKYYPILILVLHLVFMGELYAQSSGSFFMLPESFQAQMMNPAFARNDEAIIVAVAGLAGGTIGNSGNFKISDLIREQPSGDMAIDLEHFYHVGSATSRISDWSSVPLFYVGIPLENGRLSFYLKEQLYSSLAVKTSAIEFFVNGNFPDKFRSFNTDELRLSAFGYREWAAGYAFNLTDRINIGIRGKLLFGVALVELDNWEYGIETSESGEEVQLTSKGRGWLSVPYSMETTNDQLQQINSTNAVGKYLGSYHNPGFAIDFGITYLINNRNQFSFSVADLGGIWFRHNAATINQNTSYNFSGFELSNSLDLNRDSQYVDSYDVLLNTKDSIRNVFRPAVYSSGFLKQIAAKTALHYQFNYSHNLVFGITNQTAFYGNNLFNSLSFGAKQITGSFSFFENINLHGYNDVTVGGGLLWESKFTQVVLATDNFLAVYHPADQKTFSFTVGINFLINKPDKPETSKGITSPNFPFYKILK